MLFLMHTISACLKHQGAQCTVYVFDFLHVLLFVFFQHMRFSLSIPILPRYTVQYVGVSVRVCIRLCVCVRLCVRVRVHVYLYICLFYFSFLTLKLQAPPTPKRTTLALGPIWLRPTPNTPRKKNGNTVTVPLTTHLERAQRVCTQQASPFHQQMCQLQCQQLGWGGV